MQWQSLQEDFVLDISPNAPLGGVPGLVAGELGLALTFCAMRAAFAFAERVPQSCFFRLKTDGFFVQSRLVGEPFVFG